MSEYLLEIGTEEMPAGFFEKTLEQMREITGAELDKRQIAYGSLRAMGTPRRLALRIEGLGLQGADRIEEVRGPAGKSAYDGEGKPTKALLGFAAAQGVKPEELVTRELSGSVYVYATRVRKGENTAEALPGIMSGMVSALSFPKFMRWGDMDFKFARPIRWVVSLLDEEILPLTLARQQAGRISRGHRFLSGGSFSVPSASAYEDSLEKQFVLVDQERRKALIRKQIVETAEKNDCAAELDEGLLEEVTFLLEWPCALIGSFRESYLEMPEEVLVTPMREHQRYFPVRDKAGKLMNRFITLRNGGERRLDLVREGNERVLAARLSDARFFWDEDRKQPLEAFLPALEKVVFQEKLGSVGEKIRRVEALSAWLATALRADGETRENALRGAALAKADLVTNMVIEFTELQGIMGRYYALACGEKPEVAQVILEHYRPRFAGDKPAASLAGAVVAIADKMDTVAGIFAAGIEPTGSQDPYALRRAAMGICQTVLAWDLQVDLESLIWQALNRYTHVLANAEEAARVFARVMEFFAARIRGVLGEEGHRYDVIDCVMSAPFSRIQELFARAEAITGLRTDGEFQRLLAVFVRANNLVKKNGGGTVNPALFTEKAEMALHAQILAVQAAVGGIKEEKGLSGVILALSRLAGPVNDFFDAVMVMAEEADIRANRLGLLRAVIALTESVGDLSKLQE